MDLTGHIQVSNTWSLIPVSGNDREENPKRQPDTYTYVKIYTRFCMEHLLAYMQEKMAEKRCVFRAKEIQSLDTKTRYAPIGTWNQFCPTAVFEVCMNTLPEHEGIMQKNQKRLTKYLG